MVVFPTIRTASRDFYLAYLNSPDWRRRRNRALRLANWQCHACAARRELEVHHKTYERLGAEWDEDLEVLCRDCHEDHHLEKMAAVPQHNLYLSCARRALRDDPWASIADLADIVKTLCGRHRIPYNPHDVDRAIGLVSGAVRVQTKTRSSLPTSSALTRRPPTAQEARETLHRLTQRLGVSLAIKRIPSPGPSRIDIYAEPRREYVEYDRY